VNREEALIGAFVKRNKRDRYREIVANPRTRHEFTERLARFTDFDPKYRVKIPSHKLFAGNIAIELKKRHSPDIVYVISEDSMLDQKVLPLAEALERVVGRGVVAVLSCIPRCLAFVETEDERFILERDDPTEKREYIRFVVGHIDDDSHVEQGIFQAASQAIAWQAVTGPDAIELSELRMWFNENLERPTSFARHTHSLGICWFKTGATGTYLTHLEDGEHPRTQRDLCEED
jgi:hypothetical protein